MRRSWRMRAARMAVIGAAAVTVCGFVVMELWNWLAPTVFGRPEIGFWQALGLLVLARVLFGGFRGPRPGRHGHGGRFAWGWDKLSPEERKRLLDKVGHRCGAEDRPSSATA